MGKAVLGGEAGLGGGGYPLHTEQTQNAIASCTGAGAMGGIAVVSLALRFS